jgi:hypothetical protein
MPTRLYHFKRWFLTALGVWMAICASSQIRFTRSMIQAAVGPSTEGEWIIAGAASWIGYGEVGGRLEVRDWRFASIHIPADYRPGLCVWGDCEPRDHIRAITGMFSKQWTLKPYWLCAGIDAGPTALIRRQSRFHFNESPAMFESNYLQSTHTSYGAAAALRSHLDWFPTKYWGCSLGVNTLFDKTVRMAFDFAVQFGYTRFKGRR